jgi:hypothetical protein
LSYDSTAILFYGFIVEDEDEDKANNADDTDGVEVDRYGDCHGNMGMYVAHKESHKRVSLGDTLQADPEMDRSLSWDDDLKEFCEQAGINYPMEGVGWHLTVERS